MQAGPWPHPYTSYIFPCSHCPWQPMPWDAEYLSWSHLPNESHINFWYFLYICCFVLTRDGQWRIHYNNFISYILTSPFRFSDHKKGNKFPDISIYTRFIKYFWQAEKVDKKLPIIAGESIFTQVLNFHNGSQLFIEKYCPVSALLIASNSYNVQ